MAIQIKSPSEIEKMRISGIALRKVHDAVKAAVRVGATTMDLERVAVAKMAELGAVSAFQGLSRLPGGAVYVGEPRSDPRYSERRTPC